MQIKGMVITGLNFAQVDGDEVYGFYKLGLNAGVGALVPLGKNFYFGIETLYNQKEAYKKYSPSGYSSGLPYYRLKLDYLDVPFLVYYEDKHLWTFGLGFSWGRRVVFKETIRGIDTIFSQYIYDGSPVVVSGTPGEDTVLTQYPLRKSDWNVIVSLQLRVWKHLKTELRYSYSIASLGRHDYIKRETKTTRSRNLYSNMITLRLIYLLNEKYVSPQKDKNKKKKTSTYIPPWKS